MKKTYTFAIALLFAGSVFAQKNTPVTDVTPQNPFENKSGDYTPDAVSLPAINNAMPSKIINRGGAITIADTLKLVDYRKAYGCGSFWSSNTSNVSNYVGYLLRVWMGDGNDGPVGLNVGFANQYYYTKTPYTFKGVGIVLKGQNKGIKSNIDIEFLAKKSGKAIESVGKITDTIGYGTGYRIKYFKLPSGVNVTDTLVIKLSPAAESDSIAMYTAGRLGLNSKCKAHITGDTLYVDGWKLNGSGSAGFYSGQTITGNGITAGTQIKSGPVKAWNKYLVTINQNTSSDTITGITVPYDSLVTEGKFGLLNLDFQGQAKGYYEYSKFGYESGKEAFKTDFIMYPIVEYTWNYGSTIDNKCLATSKDVKVAFADSNLVRNPLFNRNAFTLKYLGKDKNSNPAAYHKSLYYKTGKTYDYIDQAAAWKTAKTYASDATNDTINVFEYILTYNSKQTGVVGKYNGYYNYVNSQYLISSKISIQPSMVSASANGVADGKAIATVTGGHKPYTYSWTGSSETTESITVAPGKYTPSITDVNGCAQAGTEITVDFNTSIREKDETTISVYPNPTNSVLNINNIGKDAKISISNTLGQVVYSSIATNNIKINTADFNKGIYFVRVNENIFKVVVE